MSDIMEYIHGINGRIWDATFDAGTPEEIAESITFLKQQAEIVEALIMGAA
jgi:hypothetical protein